jgi:hypothetical protein
MMVLRGKKKQTVKATQLNMERVNSGEVPKAA